MILSGLLFPQVAQKGQNFILLGIQPDSASIWIDGIYKGLTPILPIDISPGPHDLIVEKSGYETVGEMIAVSPTSYSFNVTLKNYYGDSSRVTLGIIPDMTSDVEGLIITGVRPRGSAETAGLKSNDIITRLGHVHIKNIYDYTSALGQFKPGDTAPCVVLRGEYPQTLIVTFSARSESKIKSPQVMIPPTIVFDVKFEDQNSNNILDAKETGKIIVTLSNTGKGKANSVQLSLQAEPANPDITYDDSKSVGDIEPGKSQTVEFELTAKKSLQEGTQTFIVSGKEGNGFHPDPVKLSFETRPFLFPKLELVDHGITAASGANIIKKGEVVEIQARIQNRGEGNADNVAFTIDLPQNVFFAQEKPRLNIDHLPVGGYKDLPFQIVTNKDAGDEIDLTLNYTEANTSGAFPLKLEIAKPQHVMQELVVKGSEEPRKPIEDVSTLSIDIEKNIPKTKARNKDAVAVVIGIADYQKPGVPRAEYAKRDASVMRQYLIDALGFTEENILPRDPDEMITAGTFKTYIRERLPAYIHKDKSDVFVYFSGHGAPSTSSHHAYLVPADCDPDFVNDDNAYSLDEFYRDLARLECRNITVVLEACFSGINGAGAMLIHQASPITLTVENPIHQKGNFVVFTASESSQVANWYPDKKHGMFTYFFLKGLQGDADLDHDGSVTIGEMERYLTDSENGVPYWSRREFQRPQNPGISGSDMQKILVKY